MRPLLFLLALAVGACGPGAPDGTRTDDTGRPFALDATPQRVVPLAPNLTELVAAAAGVERLAAVSQADAFPPEVASRPRFTSFPLDTEGLVALEPDLVLASTDVIAPAQIESLTALRLPVWSFTFDAVDDVPRALRTLDTLLATTGGAAVARDFEARRATVTEAVQGALPPRTLLLIGPDALYAFGRDSYASELVRLAGGDNLTDRYDGAAAQPSTEAVLEMSPEVIVVLGDGGAEALLDAHPALAQTPAAQQGRIYTLDPDLVSRAGPRLIDGLERLARLLHPEAFAAGAT